MPANKYYHMSASERVAVMTKDGLKIRTHYGASIHSIGQYDCPFCVLQTSITIATNGGLTQLQQRARAP